jgi:hypothetical protein
MTAAASAQTEPGVHGDTSVPELSPGRMVGPATGSIRLSGEHFAAATLYLLAGAIGLVWIAPELAAGNFLSPRVAGITHLFTLGWLTTTIFGALYRLLPVALGAPIRWPRVAHASFWTFAPGAGLFAWGVAENSTVLHHAGIGLVAIGVLLAVTNIAATLPRARSRDVTWAAITLALVFLLSTLVLGLVLLHNIHTGFIADSRVRVLATHLHVAIVGWALIMIVGVSHRLLPMFLLAHGADTRWTKRALTLLACGIPFLAVGINTPYAAVAWFGALLIELGLASFLYQAQRFYRTRVRKRIDVGMRFAAAALAFLTIAAGLGPIVLWRGPASGGLATTYVLVGLLGGIILFVIGIFYKIVPLLAWTARFSGKGSMPGAPAVADLFSARVAHIQLVTMIVAIGVLSTGVLFAVVAATYLGASLYLIGVLLFVSQIGRLALGGEVGSARGIPRGIR